MALLLDKEINIFDKKCRHNVQKTVNIGLFDQFASVSLCATDERDDMGVNIQTSVPTYALYGEYLEETRADLLHFESLRDRSERYDWSIRPHQHDTMWQFFYLKTPNVMMELGGNMVSTESPVVVSIPPLFVHGFQFPPNVFGGVISVRTPEVGGVLTELGYMNVLDKRSLIVRPDDVAFDSLVRSFENISDSFQHIDELRNLSLRCDLHGLIFSLVRYAISSADQSMAIDNRMPASHEDDVMRRFCLLVEKHYNSSWPVSFYAQELGISTVKLNRRCRRILGSSPQKMITKRRILEAKRLLQFTQMTVNEVAYQLGIADTAYFCRLFKKQVAVTPSEYRKIKNGA